MILSDKVKLYEIVGPQLKSGMWILKNSIYMLASLENPYMPE
jgi:hypothetical protein